MIQQQSVRGYLTRTRPGSALLGVLLLALSLLGALTANPIALLFFRIGYTCPLFRLTGLQCPACGTTRAVHAAAQGHWLHALSLNPLFFLAAGCYFALIVYLLFNAVRPAFRPVSLRFRPWQVRAIAVVVLGYGILRNLFGV